MLKLITLLASGIPAIITAIVGFIVRKVGTAAGSLAMFAILTVAFIQCIQLIYSAVLGAISLPTWAGNAIGMFFPANFAVISGSIFSAKTCRALYDMAREKLGLINNAS